MATPQPPPPPPAGSLQTPAGTVGADPGLGRGGADSDIVSLLQGMLLEGPPGPEGPAVSVPFWFHGVRGVLRGGPSETPPNTTGRKRGCPLLFVDTLGRSRVGRALACGRIFEFCSDFTFHSRVSQDLQERWVPPAKWVTLERG